MLKAAPRSAGSGCRRRADADGSLAILNAHDVVAAAPVMRAEPQVGNRARRSYGAKGRDVALHACDEAGCHRAELPRRIGVVGGRLAVGIPEAQVKVAAVAHRIRGRLGRECRAQPALAGGLVHDFAGQHHTVRACETRRRPAGDLELPDAVLGLEGLDPGSGVDQGCHAKIGERRDAAHGIQRERRRPADILAIERELVLVGEVQVEAGLGLQVGQRRRQETPRAALPGAPVGVEAVAERQMQGGVLGPQHDPAPRPVIGDLPHLVHRPPGVLGDVLERRHRLPRQRPAEPVGLAALVLRDGNAPGAREPHEVVPDQVDHLAAAHGPRSSGCCGNSRSSQVYPSRRFSKVRSRRWVASPSRPTMPRATGASTGAMQGTRVS